MSPAPRLVMLRAIGLGDFLTAVPAYRAVRRGFPGHRVVLAAPAGLTGLAALTGAIDEVLPTPDLRPLRWHGPSPEVAVNLHGRGPQSHRVLDALSPGRRIGYAGGGPERPWPGPAWRDAASGVGEHDVDRWCRLAASAGLPADPLDLGLTEPPADAPRREAVVVHPGAAYGCRRWPAERYAAVAAALRRHGARVVVTGSAAERPLAGEVAERAGLPADAVLAGRTDLVGLAALVAAAALVVCGDTGVAHLATAYATPSVVLFGPVSPALWGPRTDGPHRVLWRPEAVRGDRWAADPDPALLAITVADVTAAVTEALAASPPHGSGAAHPRPIP